MAMEGSWQRGAGPERLKYRLSGEPQGSATIRDSTEDLRGGKASDSATCSTGDARKPPNLVVTTPCHYLQLCFADVTRYLPAQRYTTRFYLRTLKI